MMLNSHQRRFADRLRTKRFRYGAATVLAPALLCLGSATAWADESITLDFVRHAQSVANAQGVIDTVPPGTGFTALGDQQAQAVANLLAQGAPYAGLYSSSELRAEETAAPLVELLHMPVQPPLPGLDEINAGIYEGQPVFSLAGLLYLLAPISWSLGAKLVPIPGSPDVNGFVFDQRFTDAVQTVYDNTVPTSASNPTDIAFSSAGSIVTWTMMNVNNPDFPLLLTELLKTGQFLPSMAQVVIQGDPVDGWTLVSFDGQPVPPASLPTELFVDFRNLVEAPQLAAFNIQEALLTGNPTTIMNAIDAGVSDVATAIAKFPSAVIDDILNALGGGTASTVANLGGSNLGDLSSLIPTLATDLSGLLPGEMGNAIGAAIASI